MPMGGDGPWSVAVMWVLTAIAFVFTLLRIYTRVIVVKSYGMDDHVYVLAFICILFYTIFIHIAAHYGFGQNMWDIVNQQDIMHAVLYECISQTFAVLGMAIAKVSLGLFLLRLVKATWHKVIIWVTLAMLMSASLLCLFFFWLQCSPPAFLWDRSIPGGKCELPQLGVSIYLGTACVFTDLFFAIFPWLFMWRLNMNQREKLIILSSMSLGLIAAAFGIKRATEIPKLLTDNYLKDSVGIIVWSAAEMAVTMVCIGIPVCRPLYKDYIDKITSRDSSKYKGLSGQGGVPLRTIGGSEQYPGGGGKHSHSLGSKHREGKTAESKAPGSQTSSTVGKSAYYPGDNHSDEEILSDSFKVQPGGVFADHSRGITVTEEYEVTRQ